MMPTVTQNKAYLQSRKLWWKNITASLYNSHIKCNIHCSRNFDIFIEEMSRSESVTLLNVGHHSDTAECRASQ